MLRAVLVDDSPTTRCLLSEILQREGEIEVVGQAQDGVEAVEVVQKLRPQVVVMDVHMPRMNGFEATEEIMVTAPTPIVIVTASLMPGDVSNAMQALRAGALTLLEKPGSPDSPDFERGARELVDTVKAMAQVKVVRRTRPRRGTPAATASAGEELPARAEIVAIAASTGGPPALQRLLSGLPRSFPAPIMIVQHISPGFTAGFVTWLRSTISLPVKIAGAGESLVPGTVYLAPEERHLGVSRRRTVELSDEPAIGGFRPAGTYLFQSVAQVFGPASVAVILTGMGRDGVDGLRAIRDAGGQIIAQNEASCVVFGMPRAAIEAGLADLVVRLDDLAQELCKCVQLATKK